jgi:hypothetical protein
VNSRGGLWSGLGSCGRWRGFKRRGRRDLTHQLLLEKAIGLDVGKARAEVTFGASALVLRGGK